MMTRLPATYAKGLMIDAVAYARTRIRAVRDEKIMYGCNCFSR